MKLSVAIKRTPFPHLHMNMHSKRFDDNPFKNYSAPGSFANNEQIIEIGYVLFSTFVFFSALCVCLRCRHWFWPRFCEVCKHTLGNCCWQCAIICCCFVFSCIYFHSQSFRIIPTEREEIDRETETETGESDSFYISCDVRKETKCIRATWMMFSTFSLQRDDCLMCDTLYLRVLLCFSLIHIPDILFRYVLLSRRSPIVIPSTNQYEEVTKFRFIVCIPSKPKSFTSFARWWMPTTTHLWSGESNAIKMHYKLILAMNHSSLLIRCYINSWVIIKRR